MKLPAQVTVSVTINGVTREISRSSADEWLRDEEWWGFFALCYAKTVDEVPEWQDCDDAWRREYEAEEDDNEPTPNP